MPTKVNSITLLSCGDVIIRRIENEDSSVIQLEEDTLYIVKDVHPEQIVFNKTIVEGDRLSYSEETMSIEEFESSEWYFRS